MQSIDLNQAFNGALFSFGAGLVLSGLSPFPLAICAGLSAIISSIGSDVIAKLGKEKKLGMQSAFFLISSLSITIFAFTGLAAFLSLEGILGMAFSGFVFGLWLIIRKWAFLIE